MDGHIDTVPVDEEKWTKKPFAGEVIDGKAETMNVKKGDNIIVSEYAGTKVKYEGEEYIIVKQNDILAIVL